jgi:5'-3' exonuclease, N-terminal resolvase-like domain
MHILIDGDIIGYRIGFSTEEENEKIVVSRVATFLETMLWEDLDAETYQGYLTGKDNFRNDIAVTAPYKGNRTAPKPKHLQFIRDYLVSAWDFQVSEGQEADDEIAIEHTARNYESVIASIDKDFLQLRGNHWNFVKKEMTFVTQEEATKNFYRQVLTGDRVDNIIGLKGIGPVKADKILAHCEGEAAMYSACVEAYSGEAERVIENARLLWLRREANQLWQPPTEGL